MSCLRDGFEIVEDWLQSLMFKRVIGYGVDEGLEELGQGYLRYRHVLLGLGVIVGSGVLWQLVKKQRKRALLARLRKKKQEERKDKFERLAQQIKKSKMTAEQSEAITGLSTKQLLDELQAGRLTAAKVLAAYQIKALEVHLKTNCLVEPILEAEEWAKELDQVAVRGPLHGLPVSLKECIGIKGYDVTAGCSQWIDDPCQEDSPIVQVLKQQGAIPFVRTNLPQTMISFESTNPIFGLTVNPHDPTRIAGGSSGGEGALVAGGGSPCGVGSDVGGSIRNPGAMCGVPAFKPTSLRVSKKGGRPIMAGKNVASSWGPFARDVEGLIVFMKAVLVPDMYHLDPTVPIMPFRDEVLEQKRKLKIGYSFYNGSFEAIPAMRRGVEEAKKLLESLGHQLVPWNEDLSRVADLWIPCVFADGGKEMLEILDGDAVDDAVKMIKLAASLPVSVRKFMSAMLKLFKPELSKRLNASCGYESVSELWNAIKEIKNLQNAIIERWQRNKLDAVICPAFGCLALSKGVQQHLGGVLSYTATFNVLDFPGGCVPVTAATKQDVKDLAAYPSLSKPTESHWLLKKDMQNTVGLPVCVQVVTLPWQDEQCLQVMRELETAVKSRVA